MKRSTLALLLLICLALGLALPACGGSAVDETPTAIGATGSDTPGADTSGDTSSDSDKPTPIPTPTVTGAQVGAPVAVNDYTITINSAKIDNDSLTVAVTVDNTKGSATVNLPDQTFSALAADGKTSLDPDILCTTLATRADAGKSVQGNVCWKTAGATATTGMSVIYDGGKAAKITWKLP